MARYEPAVASAVIGAAGFQLVQMWNNNAPSLNDLRNAPPGDTTAKQDLYDADLLVGGLAVILGVTFAVLAKDFTALVVMLTIFGTLSLWHHMVLNAHPV